LAIWALFASICTIALTNVYGNNNKVRDGKKIVDDNNVELTHAANEMHEADSIYRGTIVLDEYRQYHRNTMESEKKRRDDPESNYNGDNGDYQDKSPCKSDEIATAQPVSAVAEAETYDSVVFSQASFNSKL
jgi:hypothetical protein